LAPGKPLVEALKTWLEKNPAQFANGSSLPHASATAA
jgi:hypothetical protein